MADTTELEHRPAIRRLSRDLVKASTSLSEMEARFLVDAYYIAQEDRKRASNQLRAMAEEPHQLIGWLAEQSETLESQIKRSLEAYAQGHPAGQWMMSVFGIGPVIAAGLLAHIDITICPTVGHIWRYCGYDPTSKWEKGKKRPWNAGLKTLCWKIGQSFMKFSGSEDCIYGAVYKERKAYEVARNEAGQNAARAAQILIDRKFDKSTEAYKAYSAGRLPPAHIDAQARRYAVKLFLSHLHLVWFYLNSGAVPAKPYAIGHMDHTHFIKPPGLNRVEGLPDALKAAGL